MDILEELVAERACRALVALYPQYADDADAERFGALFADDGVLVAGGETITGPQAIGKWLLGTLEHNEFRHMMLNAHIVIDTPDTAHGSMDMILLRKKEGKWGIYFAPRYTDSFVRTAQGWRIQKRVLDFR